MLLSTRHKGPGITLLAVAAVLFLLPSEIFAEIVYDSDGCAVTIRGEITQATAIELKRHLPPNKTKCEQRSLDLFRFNSPGGDIDAAIQIGRAIRDVQGTTVIPPNSECASACVVSFLGGVIRIGDGKVGLHRPYSTRLVDTTNDAQQTYEAINAKLAQYMKIMNIPERLLDVMNSVPPSYIRWFSGASINDARQLHELYVLGVDPAYSDELDSLQARKYGITKREYYNRKQKAEAICFPPPRGIKPENCFDAVLRGDL